MRVPICGPNKDPNLLGPSIQTFPFSKSSNPLVSPLIPLHVLADYLWSYSVSDHIYSDDLTFTHTHTLGSHGVSSPPMLNRLRHH